MVNSPAPMALEYSSPNTCHDHKALCTLPEPCTLSLANTHAIRKTPYHKHTTEFISKHVVLHCTTQCAADSAARRLLIYCQLLFDSAVNRDVPVFQHHTPYGLTQMHASMAEQSMCQPGTECCECHSAALQPSWEALHWKYDCTHHVVVVTLPSPS